MATTDLLDVLVRPDNLVEYQIEREVRFLADHRQRLHALERAAASSSALVREHAGWALARHAARA